MEPEDVVKPRNLGKEVGPIQAEEDDAGMRSALSEDEFTKMAIVGDEDALLVRCDREHVGIVEGPHVVLTDCRNIVPQPS